MQQEKYTPIRDYGIIGNLRSAVLVSKHGSIDWAPAPFIDSPSIFAALLDAEKGGKWQLVPTQEYKSEQEYEKDTNILVTRFYTDTGCVELTDFLPLESETEYVPAEKDTTFKIHRKIECISGTVEIQHHFQPAFDYAQGETTLKVLDGGGGVQVQKELMHAHLTFAHPLSLDGNTAQTTFTLSEGEREYFVFRYNVAQYVRESRDTPAHHEYELEQTRKMWKAWLTRCDLDKCPEPGPWHEYVERSLLTLKILFFEPLGTVAAAPTTSLPEVVGGVRNWDYRYVWLRDAAFVFLAMFQTGHVIEAKEYITWLLEQCKESVERPQNLQILYGLRGQQETPEQELTHLEGYRGSQPVRIGNDAYKQRQWDTFGSVLDLVWQLHRLTGEHALEREQWDFLSSIADHVTELWREPDEGLWEVRGAPQHFVYSKVMCWVALDRALKIAAAHGYPGNRELWEKERDAIREEVLEKGWDEDVGAFVQSFGSKELDASVLQMPAVGFIDGADPKMQSTIHVLQEHLGRRDGLLRRYTSDDGLPGEEGAFLIGSFWLVDALCHAGEIDKARELLDTLCGHANHLGLFAEEMDPETGEFLGNFPQAYTHIGLINSAMLLTNAMRERGSAV